MNSKSNTIVFWFRCDLRLHDHPALQKALDIVRNARSGLDAGTAASKDTRFLPIICLPDFLEESAWGFSRMSALRRYWYLSAVRDLAEQFDNLACPVLICPESATTALPRLAQSLNITEVVCEEIAAPFEQEEVTALRASGLLVTTVWQSSLLDPADLPWISAELPAVFTEFRQMVERAKILPPKPIAVPTSFPPRPELDIPAHLQLTLDQLVITEPTPEPRSSFAIGSGLFNGGERAALSHLNRYLNDRLPHTYKQTRNQLMGLDYSSKWSPWLATGALSARKIFAELKKFEAHHGANDGSYWLWFELLWRDYFRFLHVQYGLQLYRARGLHDGPLPDKSAHRVEVFQRWCDGETGEALIDAAMRELKSTGYLSNRLRQVVASYFIYQLHGDWRAGAAWFEAQLLDYDVYSNQGNWLYIAGRGTDPRGGRIFNVQKQVHDRDRDGVYRRTWGTL